MVPGFKLTTFETQVSAHNQMTRTPAFTPYLFVNFVYFLVSGDHLIVWPFIKWTEQSKLQNNLQMFRSNMNPTQVTFLVVVLIQLASIASPRTFGVARHRRHTPFLPGDYWKDQRPDFGSTETTLNVMENSTAKFKCPITHVADSSVSYFCSWHPNTS